MMNKKKNFLKVSLESFSSLSLNKAIKAIKEHVKSNFGIVVGPVFMPIKTRSFSIRRSPHIYGGSRETISLNSRKRVLYITFDNPEKNINLENFVTPDVCVKVSFKELSYKRPDVKKKTASVVQKKTTVKDAFSDAKPLSKTKTNRSTRGAI